MKSWLATLCPLLLIGCGAGERQPETELAEPPPPPVLEAAAQAPFAACQPGSASGFCGVSFGIPMDQALEAFPAPLQPVEGSVEPSEPEACRILLANGEPDTISFLFENGNVSRADVVVEGPETSGGIGVGATEADVRAAHAGVTSSPDKYDPAVTQLEVVEGAGKIIYRLRDGRVFAWRVGIPPAVDYVEGCG